MRIFGRSSQGYIQPSGCLEACRKTRRSGYLQPFCSYRCQGFVLQTGGLHFCRLNREERLKLALFLARRMHRPSEVMLQPAVGSGTMTGIHVYGQKARLSNSGFIYVL